jgi:hypothetical protein
MKFKIILLALLLLSCISFTHAQYGPVVSFSYDDGDSDWYDKVFPIFQEHGFPGVVYINAINWWIENPATIDLLHEMQEAGWEISSHTYNHNLELDSLMTETNVGAMKHWLDSLGFPNSGISCPTNYLTRMAYIVAEKYHPYFCAASTNLGGISHPLDLYNLLRFSLTNNETIESIGEYLDDAIANNKWIIFYAHQIGGTYGDSSTWFQSEELLRMALDAVEERGIPVRTVREVINDLFPSDYIVKCSVDSLQEPVLTYFEQQPDGEIPPFNSSEWNEYWHRIDWANPYYVGTPAVYCHTSNDTLPVMKFHRYVTNGDYEVRATIVEFDPGRTYRLYYSFDSLNTSQYYVDVDKNSDVSLGAVTVTDGKFSFYTQKAEVISDNDDGYVGLALIRLIPKPLLLNLKVLLEGPYIGSGLMSTVLNTSVHIPLSSNKAYPTIDYGYYTVSNLADVPNSDIVDWVLVELRTGTSSETTVSKRIAFLKSDGTIVDTDGVSPISFTGLNAGNYYVVVRHRNHLAIMSSSPISLSSSLTSYDFTTFQSKAYGEDAMKNLGNELYGMIAGDANQDGYVTSSDFNMFNPSFTNAASGYDHCDWNLDGFVTSTDFNFFNPNFTNAKQSFVP